MKKSRACRGKGKKNGVGLRNPKKKGDPLHTLNIFERSAQLMEDCANRTNLCFFCP
jgi:hypothetical protein